MRECIIEVPKWEFLESQYTTNSRR